MGFTLICCLQKPFRSLSMVSRHASSVFIQPAEKILSIGIALLSRLAIPIQCLRIVEWHPITAFVHVAKHRLRAGVILICCLQKPFRSFSIILRHSIAIVIAESEVVLSRNVTFFGIGFFSFGKDLVVQITRNASVIIRCRWQRFGVYPGWYGFVGAS